MSTPATIPVFDPQGVLRDIPEDRLKDAVQAGGMPAVKFQAPDKSIRFVPANRTKDAYDAGGKLMPFEQQDVKHPGFWSTLGDDLKSMARGASSMLSPATPGLGAIPWAANLATEDIQRQAEGRSIPYRVAAPIAESLTGANVRGMEESANQGDVSGILGHAAAVPTVMAAAEGAARVLPAAASARPAAASALRTAADVVSPDVTGLFSPRLAHVQKLLGRFADALAKKPEEFSALDATGENKPYAGEPARKAPKQNEYDATGENKPFAGGMDEAPEPAPARPSIERLPQPTSPLDRLRNQVPPPAVDYTPPRPSIERILPQQAPPEASTPQPMATTATGEPIARVVPALTTIRPDQLVSELRRISRLIAEQESTAKASAPEEDLTQLLQDSLAAAKAKKANPSAGAP